MNEKRKFFDEVSESQGMNHFRNEDVPKLKKLISLWELRKGDVILEAGSGAGRLTPYLLETIGEEGKVSLRNVRRQANDDLKAAQKKGDVPEDESKRATDEIQKKLDENAAKIDQLVAEKTEEIMNF